jgi:uncharacterized membrane protein
MTKILEFIKTTIMGGLLFLLPIAATALIFFKAGKMAAEVAAPLADKLPLPKAEAVILLYLLATILAVLLSFIAGVFIRVMPYERKIMLYLEERFLRKFPPYMAAKKYTNLIAGMEINEGMKPALVCIGNAWQLGFVIEQFNESNVVAFVPSAPDPSSGDIFILPNDAISSLSVPNAVVVQCIEKSGKGLSDIIAKSAK